MLISQLYVSCSADAAVSAVYKSSHIPTSSGIQCQGLTCSDLTCNLQMNYCRRIHTSMMLSLTSPPILATPCLMCVQCLQHHFHSMNIQLWGNMAKCRTCYMHVQYCCPCQLSLQACDADQIPELVRIDLQLGHAVFLE